MTYQKICPKCGRLFDTELCPDCFTKMTDTEISEDGFWEIVHLGLSKKEQLYKKLREKYVINSPEFDEELYNKNLKREADLLESTLKHMTREQLEKPFDINKYKNRPKCPTCGSINIQKISGAERGMSVLTLGFFSKKINKSFKCNDCKYTW